MPDFTLHCADRKTGKDYTVRVPAPSPEIAREWAIRQGHMVGAVDAPPPAEGPDHLSVIEAGLASIDARIATIESCRLIRRPRDTIAWGVILALGVWFVLSLLGAFALWSYNQAAIARQLGGSGDVNRPPFR